MVWIGGWSPQGGSIPEMSHCWHRCHLTSRRGPEVYFDSHLTMKAHVARVARTCIFHLHRLRSIRRSLGHNVTTRLVSALVISRLDYYNSVLTHLLASVLVPLQTVLCCLVGSWFESTWSCDTGDVWTWLVTNCWENQVQTLPFGTPCSQWLSTVVLDRIGCSCGQHPRMRLSPLSWKARSGCSVFETGLIRAGVLCRCTKSVERPVRWH